MHYTCIHDRRDVLTSPLCHNLQQTTQISIRNFLERAQDGLELTNQALAIVIASCEEEVGKTLFEHSQQWQTGSTKILGKSPLQDILKTPNTKGSRLIEKDKEINKLKTDLELVQEEKYNLEEDLRFQTEKNKKLGM